MRKAWIQRKAAEPLSFQRGVRLFRNPPGQTAATLIDRAHMTKAKYGSAELSERNSNYAVAHSGTMAQDILHLADEVRARVQERLVEWYRRRGGHIEMPLYDTIPRPFVISPDYPDSLAIVSAISDFVAQHG